jgi:AbrB family looped-hinge helix DNA binding protein
METLVDKFGRVLIPKAVRDHLGLKPGAVLQIIEKNHDVVLRMSEHESPLKRKGSVMIFTGRATGDIESAIQLEREKRLKDIESH